MQLLQQIKTHVVSCAANKPHYEYLTQRINEVILKIKRNNWSNFQYA